ncbi:c-type cytochrome [Erythrobacter sp.]|uniref:c-type cytochrome n=1 Tax=Erythrobacter sp. TaxID=1042 RepID=UPI003C776602
MKKLFASAVAMTSLVALSACGGGNDDAADDTAATETPATPEPAAEPEMTDVAFSDLEGDASAGETVFVKCKTCHVLEEGENRVGPHLYGVVGREAGSVEGFNYSDANANSGITWNEDVLFEYLENPQEYLPGTRMAFPGIRDAQERADLIAYLDANGEV